MDVKPIDLRNERLTKGDLIKLLEPLPDDAVMRAFCNGCSGFITRLTYDIRPIITLYKKQKPRKPQLLPYTGLI